MPFTFMNCYFYNDIFRVSIKPGGSLNISIFGVQPLYQYCSKTIKPQGLSALGASSVKLLMYSHVGFSWKFVT